MSTFLIISIVMLLVAVLSTVLEHVMKKKASVTYKLHQEFQHFFWMIGVLPWYFTIYGSMGMRPGDNYLVWALCLIMAVEIVRIIEACCKLICKKLMPLNPDVEIKEVPIPRIILMIAHAGAAVVALGLLVWIAYGLISFELSEIGYTILGVCFVLFFGVGVYYNTAEFCKLCKR